MQRTFLNLILFIIKVAILWAIFACQQNLQQKEYYPDGSLKHKFTFYRNQNGDLLKHGDELKKYPNGKTASTLQYKNGEKNGIEKIFTPEGILISQTYYTEGSPDEFTEWDWDGNLIINQKLKRVKSYHNLKHRKVVKHIYTTLKDPAIRHGPYREYFNNGNLKFQTEYFKGLKQGPHIEYYYNGQLFKKGRFDEDKKEGLWITWFTDGKMQSKTNYNQGNIYGEYCRWYPNGSLSDQAIYEEGELISPFISWHPNGEFSKKYEVSENGKDKISMDWFPNGQIKSVKKKSSKTKAQPVIEWFPSGQLKYIANYQGKKLNGKFHRWHQNGMPFVRANYSKGNLDGLYRWWENNGNLISYRKYRKGKLLYDSKSDMVRTLMGAENYSVPIEFLGFQWGMTREETKTNILRLGGKILNDINQSLQARIEIFPKKAANISLGFNDWNELWDISFLVPSESNFKFSQYTSWIEKEIGHKLNSKKVYVNARSPIRSAESNWGEFYSQSQKKFSPTKKNHVVSAHLYQEKNRNQLHFVFRNYLIKYYSQTNHIIVGGPDYNIDSEG